jgi:hypothetical protein
MRVKIDAETATAIWIALTNLAERRDIYISPKVAAVLSGRAVRAIRTAVDAGELAAEGRTRRLVNAADLSRWAGRESNFNNQQWARCFERIARGSESGARAAV